MSSYYILKNFEIAKNYYKQGKVDITLKQLNTVSLDKIKNYDILCLYGSTYIRKYILDKAKEDLEHKEDHSQSQEDIRKAKDYFNQCISLDNRNPKAYTKLIELNLRIKDYPEAERYAEKAGKINPDDLNYLKYYASLLFIKRKFEKCIPVYNKILERQDLSQEDRTTSLLNKIKCLFHLGNFNEARDLVDEIKKQDDIIKEPKILKKLYEVEISLLKNEGDFENAKNLVNNFQVIFKDDYQEYRYLSVSVEFLEENYDTVIEIGKPLSDIVFNKGDMSQFIEYDYLALFYIACSYRNKQELEKFLEIFDVLKEHKNYENEEYFLELAKYYHCIKDYDTYEVYIQKSLRQKSNYVPALKYKIYYYLAREMKDEANKVYEQNKKLLNDYEFKVKGQVFNMESVSVQFSQLSTGSTDSKEGLIIKKTSTRVIDKESAKNVIAVIGQGGFGIVTKEKVEGKILACKRLTFGDDVDPETQAQLTKDLRKEIVAMVELEHTNVVKLEGFFQGKIMMELLEGGDLDGLLRKNPNVPIKLKIYFSLGIAEGLAYIHENEIVHGDMKPKNILLDRKYNPEEPDIYPCPKITDFGLSGVRKGDAETLDVKGVTMNYTAPEVFSDLKVSPKTDVFSFGLTMYEIFSGKVPFSSMNNQAIKTAIMDGTLPDFDKDLKEKVCPQEVREIIEKSCSFSPDDRDEMRDIADQLRNIYENYEQEE